MTIALCLALVAGVLPGSAMPWWGWAIVMVCDLYAIGLLNEKRAQRGQPPL